MNILEELKQMRADCEPRVLACWRSPESLDKLEIAVEEMVDLALDIRLRVRAGKMHWRSAWARELRDRHKAEDLLKELESKT